MARGFGSTLGAGTTDSIETASFTTPVLRSISLWVYRNGEGGSNQGRMYGQTDGVSVSHEALFNDLTAGVYRFLYRWSAGVINCTWDITRPAANEWHHIGVSYDRGSTSNDPKMYLDGVSQTVTESAGPPSGSAGGVTTIRSIGNRDYDDARVWDGSLAEFAYWNVILTDDEFASLGAGVSPMSIRPISLVDYIPDDRAYWRSAVTITGTAVQPHPRMHYPSRHRIFLPVAAAGGVTYPMLERGTRGLVRGLAPMWR